jgi:hypothetical protein
MLPGLVTTLAPALRTQRQSDVRAPRVHKFGPMTHLEISREDAAGHEGALPFQPGAGDYFNEALSAVKGKIIFNSSAGPGWYADARHDIIRNTED